MSRPAPLSPITRLDQNTRRARAVVHGQTVYLAGHTAADRSQDAAGQTRQVLQALEDLLAQAGSDKRHLLDVTIWLSSMDDFEAMNRVYDAWIVPGHAPARRCAAMMLAAPEIRVEISGIAAV
ncbi:RidA family protein [Bordetella trematum]|uniref:RidA family protein n=1 Tax=Bordetella trematum TaxID=123899 RepID=UPI0015C55A55|nr:RidA family protein [Bordetella trematum]